MAPTNERGRRGGHRSGTVWGGGQHRNANTNAGISRNSTDAARDGTRARYVHRRRARSDRAPTGPRLINRMTYGDGRGRGRSGTSRPVPQRGRFHQKIDGRAEGGQEGTDGVTEGDEGADLAVNEETEMDIDNDSVNDAHSFASAAVNNTSFSQPSSTLLYSQATQVRPSTPTFTVSPPILPNLKLRHNTTNSSNRIRLINEPLTPDQDQKRPVNTYRGRDPIKKIVQNKKLQAIFAGKQMPKERGVYKGERMELRLSSGGKVLK
jgi:hypothetical protein